jgi:hypothetical protein
MGSGCLNQSKVTIQVRYDQHMDALARQPQDIGRLDCGAVIEDQKLHRAQRHRLAIKLERLGLDMYPKILFVDDNNLH